MGLEAATYIHQLNPSNPVGAVDPKAQGDDHLRMIKSTIQATFPTINGPVTVTLANLNQWAGLAGAYAWTGQHSWALALRAPDGAVGTPAFTFASDTDTGFYRVAANRIGAAVNGAQQLDITVTGVEVLVGQCLAPVGSVGSPGFAIGVDPDSGMYRAGANNMRLAAGGIDVWGFANVAGTAFNQPFGVIQGVIDGTAGIPLYSFNNDPDTGIYRSGANSLGFASNGVRVAEVTPAQFGGIDGALGAPIYTFILDPDTGFWRAASGDIAVSCNGAEALRIRGDGLYTRFGVNNVFGAAAGPSYTFDTDNDTGLYRIAADQLGFAEGGVGFRVGFRNIPQNIQNANYTAVAADTGKHLLHGNGAGAGHTHTIPSNAAVPYDIGTAITFINRDSNVISIAITTDTLILANTVLTGTRTLAANGIATAIKVAATTWMISGTGIG